MSAEPALEFRGRLDRRACAMHSFVGKRVQDSEDTRMRQADSEHLMLFARRLRDERKRLGWNQREFAAAGGVGLASQTRYEVEGAPPSVEYLVRLEQSGADVVYIISGQRSAELATAAETALLDSFRQLDEPGQSAVLTVISAMTKQTG